VDNKSRESLKSAVQRQGELKMKQIGLRLISGFVLSTLTCAAAWAQATAQIGGTVRDQSGAVLPGVEIMAVQTETGIARTAITTEIGSYLLSNLATGPYRLEASLPGFRTFVQTGIVLQVNKNAVINPVLEVGQVSDQVEVQANAALVEMRATGVGQVIENARILELPLNGREVTDLIVLAGAAVNTATPATNSRVIKGRAYVSVAGGLGGEAGYVLDGVTHNDPYDNNNLPFPFPDALQEFKVETGALSAQSGGMHAAAAVTAVTKSGTNDFHGSAFEFLRNDRFKARNYFATEKDRLKRHQLGGTLGGPIVRGKFFFFGGYQGTFLRANPADTQAFVPTAAMLAGDFTAFASAACNGGRPLTLKTPFIGNQVDPALFSPAARNIASKLPKTSDPCGRLVYGSKNSEDDHQVVGKIDYQLSDKQSVFGRFIDTSIKIAMPYSLQPDNVLNTVSPGYDNLGQTYAVGHTYLMSSNAVNAFRLAVNRTAVQRMIGKFFGPQDVGIKMYTETPDVLQVIVTGGFSFGGSNSAKFHTTTYNINDDFSLVRGPHQMSFGTNLAHWRSNGYTPRWAGQFDFDASVTGAGLGDFLLGKVRTLQQQPTNVLLMREWYVGLYAQDTWKAAPRVTLTYGLYWQPGLAQKLRENTNAWSFSYDRFKSGVKSTVFKNAPAGVAYAGDPGFPGNSTMYNHWLQFGPRVGVAWDPQGGGRMSVRASYALAYERPNAQWWQSDGAKAPPFGGGVLLQNPVGGLDNPYLDFPGGSPFPRTVDANTSFPPYNVFVQVPYDIKPTKVHSWDLTLQKQVASDWLLSTSYLGRHITNVWLPKDLNYGIYFPGGPCTIRGVNYATCSANSNLDQRRRLSFERPQEANAFGALTDYDDASAQNYHAMLFSIQRSVAKAMTVSTNYTWSRCIGDAWEPVIASSPDSRYVTDNGIAGYSTNWQKVPGDCATDRRHAISITGVVDAPRFTNTMLRAALTGWRLAGIYKNASGESLTITSGQDRALTGVASQRPNQVLENPYSDRSGRPLTQYFNPAAFAQAPLGSYGTMGRSNVKGPGMWQFDAALSRIFTFRESQRIEFRAEAYNVLNHFQPASPAPLSGNPSPTVGTNINSANTFGLIRTAADPRILQFALKYFF
jgi:hypothetical protein